MRTNPIKWMFLIAGSSLLLQAGVLFAADAPPPSPASPQESWTGAARPPMNWAQHTQRMLD